MRKTLIFAIFILFFTLHSAATYAAGIAYFGTEISLYENTAHVLITITFDSSNVTHIKIPFFNNIQNLMSESNFGNEKCISEKKNYGYDIVCNINPTSEKRMLKLEFDSFDIIKPIGKQMMFSSDFYMPLKVKTLDFKVMLPEGMVLAENSDLFGPYTPLDGEKGSDGRRIYVYWKKNNISAGESFSSRVFYESIEKNNFVFIGMIFGFVIILSILGVIIFIIKKTKAGMNVVLPILKEDEKILMELIVKHKGAVNQKLLVLESNYSKAKVSKVLSSLQERGLIRLEHTGRSNKVYLSDEYKNVKFENKGKVSFLQKIKNFYIK